MQSRIKRNFNNSSVTSSEYKNIIGWLLKTKLENFIFFEINQLYQAAPRFSRSTLAVFELTPDQFNESLDELIMFLAQVTFPIHV